MFSPTILFGSPISEIGIRKFSPRGTRYIPTRTAVLQRTSFGAFCSLLCAISAT